MKRRQRSGRGSERSISTIHIGINIRHHYWIYSTAVCLCACIHTQHKHVSSLYMCLWTPVKLTQEHSAWPG